MVELLLERGGLLDHQDSQGYSPLHHAVLHCQVQVVRLLLDQGAGVDIKDNQGKPYFMLQGRNGALISTKNLSSCWCTISNNKKILRILLFLSIDFFLLMTINLP